MGSEIGVEKVKRKQLPRTGPQVFAPSQSSVSKFSYCVPMCVFASFFDFDLICCCDDSSTFLAFVFVSSLCFGVLSPMFYDRILHSLPKSNLCFSRAFSEDGVTD